MACDAAPFSRLSIEQQKLNRFFDSSILNPPIMALGVLITSDIEGNSSLITIKECILLVRRTSFKAVLTWVLVRNKKITKQIRKIGNGASTVSRRPNETDCGVPSPSEGALGGPSTHIQATV